MGHPQAVGCCAYARQGRPGAAREVMALPGLIAPPGERAAGPDGRAAPIPLRGMLGRALPVSVAIPKIGVHATLARVGRGRDGAIVPPPGRDRDRAGWYERGPSPGEPGAAVLVGHLATSSGPAVFARLRELRPGDLIGVVRADDTVAVFRMVSAEQAPKGSFPAARVHASGGRPELRLITCAGRYDRARRAYDDNLIVYATFAAAYRLTDLVRT
ncbi:MULTISPECIES: class F sortase [Thermomonosporaceae]|uniref:class F sortase n=1 Tax=Thermomonosporaceae TaxID=2012 RepID=UPI00255AE6FD|nr:MULTISPECIES: class F sortase [Thermomonosporaceae]MDL4776274.1 class F sortase [Actinomadura xylanilytica]